MNDLPADLPCGWCGHNYEDHVARACGCRRCMEVVCDCPKFEAQDWGQRPKCPHGAL